MQIPGITHSEGVAALNPRLKRLVEFMPVLVAEQLVMSFGWLAIPKVLTTFVTDALGSFSLGTKGIHGP
ncbi:MAG: hypothetical protein ACI87E_004522 [Mariniblastus sp.]|jgi:hypothetical protein